MPLQPLIDQAADLIASGGPREPGDTPHGWPAEAERIVRANLPAGPAAALELGYRLGYAVAQRDARARAAAVQ